jgi:glycine cleavage system H protein
MQEILESDCVGALIDRSEPATPPNRSIFLSAARWRKAFIPNGPLPKLPGMDAPAAKTVFFKRSHFVTHLPAHFRYTRSHFWAEPRGGKVLRIGFTKFATRMLGEMVDHSFDLEAGTEIRLGQVLGWIEGFKAISDLISVAEGTFSGGNPLLKEQINLVTESNYSDGWLYEAEGKLDEQSLDVQEYAEYLKKTIDRILESQAAEGEH